MNCLPALVIETSTPAASVALVRGNGEIGRLDFSSDRSHNAALFQPLGELIARLAGEKPRRLLVGSGPGSYSGTRVGIAAAQGVAIASGCPAVAVPSILAVPAADHGRSCLAIGDARRGSFWTAGISENQLRTPPVLTDRDGLLREIEAALARDSTVFSLEDVSKFPLPPEMLRLISVEKPDAARLWRAWQATPSAVREKWSAEIAQPMYLKPPHITPAKRSWLVAPGNP
ncbi:MAG: tRNA (adenosine(37)-N6)-threonylcarbamoyltransferase complex dimerization subunit type 1 TsaB [Luteolibacter sp.]